MKNNKPLRLFLILSIGVSGWNISGMEETEIEHNGHCTNLNQQLLSAAEADNSAQVQTLLDRCAKINTQNDHKSTPLHLAAYKGHANAASLLLDRGAPINAQDDRQRTPLHVAAEKGHANIVSLLL